MSIAPLQFNLSGVSNSSTPSYQPTSSFQPISSSSPYVTAVRLPTSQQSTIPIMLSPTVSGANSYFVDNYSINSANNFSPAPVVATPVIASSPNISPSMARKSTLLGRPPIETSNSTQLIQLTPTNRNSVITTQVVSTSNSPNPNYSTPSMYAATPASYQSTSYQSPYQINSYQTNSYQASPYVIQSNTIADSEIDELNDGLQEKLSLYQAPEYSARMPPNQQRITDIQNNQNLQNKERTLLGRPPVPTAKAPQLNYDKQYVASQQRTIPIMNNTAPVMDGECDVGKDMMGFGIFEILDKKYKADRIFNRAQNKIESLKKTNSITDVGYLKLTEVVDLYSEMYTKFIWMVTEKRQYIQKAGSSPPIDIVTPKDWGECIIELINLVLNFEAVLKSTIDEQTSPKALQRQCSNMDLKNCDSPCSKTGLITKTCTYKK